MKQQIVVALVALICVGCKTVTVRVAEDGEPMRKITVPFTFVKSAIRFTDTDQIEIDDLGGFDSTIDLAELATAIRDAGPNQLKIHIEQEDTVIDGYKAGNVFRVQMNNSWEENTVTLNLPLALMDKIADGKERGHLDSRDLLKAFRRYKGVFVEMKSPYEEYSITFN